MKNLISMRLWTAADEAVRGAATRRMGLSRRLLCRTAGFGLMLLVGGASALAQTTAKAAEPVSKIEVEVVQLTKNGCFPSTIQRPAGSFRLLVLNRTGVQNVQFSLAGGVVGGVLNAVAAKQFSAVETNWAQLLNLAAGQYTISAPNDSQHVCTIVIK